MRDSYHDCLYAPVADGLQVYNAKRPHTRIRYFTAMMTAALTSMSSGCVSVISAYRDEADGTELLIGIPVDVGITVLPTVLLDGDPTIGAVVTISFVVLDLLMYGLGEAGLVWIDPLPRWYARTPNFPVVQGPVASPRGRCWDSEEGCQLQSRLLGIK